MFWKERINDMKNKNRVEQYFYQKDFSIMDIVLLILAAVSLVVATFVQGGGPMGLPILLICIVVFCICRSFRTKDNEIDQALKRIILDNKIEYSKSAMESYDLRNTVIKKRKDGKLISPNYYITDVISSSVDTLFKIYIIDLINSSVKMVSRSVNYNEKVTLCEERIKTDVGSVKVSYLKIDDECVIPVALNDYKTSQLVEKICEKHKNQ